MKSPPSNWVYMSGPGEVIRQLASGLKAAAVTAYRGTIQLHLRRFFGASFLRFPSKDGITLSLDEFESLMSLQQEILEDFNRLTTDKETPVQYTTGPSNGDVHMNYGYQTEYTVQPPAQPPVSCYGNQVTQTGDSMCYGTQQNSTCYDMPGPSNDTPPTFDMNYRYEYLPQPTVSSYGNNYSQVTQTPESLGYGTQQNTPDFFGNTPATKPRKATRKKLKLTL